MKLTKAKKIIVTLLSLLLIILSPLLLHVVWILKPRKTADIIIIDKTVSDLKKNEHASFIWSLNNLKVVKRNKELYSIDDYYGFFPQKEEAFYISDFERMDSIKLRETARRNQVIYITDSYGVYSNEWYQHQNISERSNLIYGGLTDKEVLLLKQMKQDRKLILSEFNCIGSPTKREVRNNFEELFHVRWTGWIGRYFENLLESNADIPRWLINNYKKQHNNKWAFRKSGIAFVNENDQIEILEEGKELVNSIPAIYTNKENADKFKLPEMIPYPYWFDIMQTDYTNVPVSVYHINTTAKGDSILKKNGILQTFPAVLQHRGEDYHFYYFAGDFADNAISMHMAHYSGIATIKSFLSSFHGEEREDFFWNYYFPMITYILKDYQNSRPAG